MKQKKQSQQPSNMGFLAFLADESERQRQNSHFGVANNYRSASNSFARFLQLRKKKDVSFACLTPQLMADYEAWLMVDGLCKNTSSFYLRILQAVYHKAVRRGVTDDCCPFKNVYRGVARTVKRAIAPHEVCLLRDLDLRSLLMQRGYTGKRLERKLRQLDLARDLFLFSFCARGLTFVDMAYLQKSNLVDGVLTYVRRKTKMRIVVQVEPMMQAILDRHPTLTNYLLPILDKAADREAVYRQYRYRLARYNNDLRMLGEMLGGVKLTSYVSRHSWATAAHQQQVPLSVISQSMGHDSERTTEIYLKSLQSSVIHKANHELLAQVFHAESEGREG